MFYHATGPALGAITPHTQIAKAPIVCYTPESEDARAVAVAGWCSLNPSTLGIQCLGLNA